jgi:hypothetical protein
VPYVAEDGQTIQMTVIATAKELFSHDAQQLSSTLVQLPLPHFRLRPIAVSVSILDGQTLVVGYPLREANEIGSTRKYLLLLITPTIIDSAGNPIRNSAPAGQK